MFAEKCNVPSVDTSTLITKDCLEGWRRFQKYKSAVGPKFSFFTNSEYFTF